MNINTFGNEVVDTTNTATLVKSNNEKSPEMLTLLFGK